MPPHTTQPNHKSILMDTNDLVVISDVSVFVLFGVKRECFMSLP